MVRLDAQVTARNATSAAAKAGTFLRKLGARVPEARAQRGRRIRADQLKVFAELQSHSVIFAPVILAFFAACFAIEWVSFERATLWWGAMMGVLFLNYAVVRRFLRDADRTESQTGRWEQRWHYGLAFTSLIVSLCWASFSFVFWAEGNALNNALIIASLTASTAPLAIFACSYHPAFYTTVVPVCAVTVLRLLSTPEPINWLGALVFALFTMLLSRMCAYVNDFLQRSFYLAEERKGLIDALSHEKRALDKARRKAEEASRAKTLFLANMSHELRTPLNAIIGFSEVMHSELFGRHVHENYRQYAKDINSSGQHLLGLINDILDLSRIEAGRMELVEELLDMPQLARDCCKLVELRASVHNVTIVEEFDAELPLLRADGRALRQTWLNLLTNAVKFSPPDRSVFLLAKQTEDGGLMIGVADEGPGIAEDELETVLHSFAQGAAGKKNPGSGTGLGLAIVRGLVEEHGGMFRLTSRLGEGTQATAIFPPSRVVDRNLPDEIDADACEEARRLAG